MGLLDDFSEFAKTPEGQGLLSAAFGGLAGARRGAGPLNTIGTAGLAGINGYGNAQDQQQRLKSASLANTMTQMQVDQMKRQQDQQNYIEQAAQGAYKQPMTADQNAMAKVAQSGGPVGPTVQAANMVPTTAATPGGMDSQALISAIAAKYPMVALDMQQKAKQAGRVTLKKDEVVYDDNTGKPIYNNVQPEIKNGYIVADGKGGFAIDPKLYEAERVLKATGAPKVSVSPVIQTGTTFGKNVAEAGANQLMSQVDAARNAPQLATDAQGILNAIEQKGVLSGPGTSWKMTANQMFGTNQDSLNSTRQVIQGLAKLGLASRQSLKGQGAITDYEQRLLENAASGNIDNLTKGEIQLIANGAIRSAGTVYKQGKVASDALSKMPELQSILPAFQLPEFAQPQAASLPTPAKSIISNGGWNAKERK